MSKTYRPLFSIVRRPMILLEILIALAMIALCALPLITPHVAMIKEQKHFINTMKLDHYVHLIYVDILEQLHTNKIGWNVITEKTPIPLDESLIARLGETNFPKLKGYFRFHEIKHKINKSTGWSAYLLKLNIVFEPDEKLGNKTQEFPYTVYLLRKTEPEEETSKPAEKEKEKEKPKKTEDEDHED